MSGRAPCYITKAVYSFEASQPDELSFAAGDILAMAPAQQQTLRSHGWMMATRLRDAAGNPVPKPTPVGMVPLNHFSTLYNSTCCILYPILLLLVGIIKLVGSCFFSFCSQVIIRRKKGVRSEGMLKHAIVVLEAHILLLH